MTRSASPSRTAPSASARWPRVYGPPVSPMGPPLLLCLSRFLVEGLDDLVGQVRLRGAVDDAGATLLDDEEEALLLADALDNPGDIDEDLLEEPLLLPLQLGAVVIHYAPEIPHLPFQRLLLLLAGIDAEERALLLELLLALLEFGALAVHFPLHGRLRFYRCSRG